MFFFKKEKNNEEVKNDKINVNVSLITTFIGNDTVFKGDIITKSSIRIDGEVIGNVKCEGVVVLTKEGKITGTVEAENIVVAGTIHGNMSIRDKVNVEASGQIYGNIITKKFDMDEESVFEGQCTMNKDGEYIPVEPYKAFEDKKESESNQSAKNENSSNGKKSRSRKNKNKANNTDTVKEDLKSENQNKTDAPNNDEKKVVSEKTEKTDTKDSSEEKDSDIDVKDIEEIEKE